MSTKDISEMPRWRAPQGTSTELSIYNSLTRSKVPFVITRKDGRIGWYICGPTVYDAAHMGHARSYVTFDILRRLLENYFSWPIIYVMNITDIDDKIIVRARQNYLLNEFLKENNICKDTCGRDQRSNDSPIKKDTVLSVVITSFVRFVNMQLSANLVCDTASEIPDFFKKATDRAHSDPKFALAMENISRIYHSGVLPVLHSLCPSSVHSVESKIQHLSISERSSLFQSLSQCSDCIGPYLDSQKGDQVTDHRIFKELSEFWETSFMDDMKRLDVLPPTVLTRVTQYLPQIVTYIEKIMARGYAYEVQGSIYFDTQAFTESEHFYAKLEPSSANNINLLNEGEGSLSLNAESQGAGDKRGKKNGSDFALWKKSKRGEPRWNSPWSEGRPGWHIECSAMAGDVLGDTLDIHSGGIDLRFPHHDNEIAQSEAHYDCDQWVNYFMHTGHLHIEGQKMSKSLKNFVTIQEGLEKYSARQMRLMFLLHSWQDTLDYKLTTMEEAIQAERWLFDFFATLFAVGIHRRSTESDGSVLSSYVTFLQHAQNMTTKINGQMTTGGIQPSDLLAAYVSTLTSVHLAMCDSLDTPRALRCIFDLCKSTKAFVNCHSEMPLELLSAIGSYVTWWLSCTGVIIAEEQDEKNAMFLGFPNQASRDLIYRPCLSVLSQFRDEIRILARFGLESEDEHQHHASSSAMRDSLKKVLARCDKLRDEDVGKMGFEVEDREDMSSLIKTGDPRWLAEKVAAKNKGLKEKEDRKRALLAKVQDKEREKIEKAKISPTMMFKGCKEFSQFDEKGIPTHDEKGELLSKNRIKKLSQEYDAQKKLYEEYVGR